MQDFESPWRPNVVRSQPRASSIGNWKKPIAERGPNVNIAIRQPQMITASGIVFAWVFVVFTDIATSVLIKNYERPN